MNLQMGSQSFSDVEIPVLWGTRAVIQDKEGRLSVIDLSRAVATLEILGDQPAPGATFLPSLNGFQILENGTALYNYNPTDKTLSGLGVKLPECQILPNNIRVGESVFAGNIVSGFGVGILVNEDGFGMGAPLPPGLAKLVV